MFVAFDVAKLLGAPYWTDDGKRRPGVSDDETITVHRPASNVEALDVAIRYGIRPFFCKVLDVDDTTQKIRNQFDHVLLAGKDAEQVRGTLAKIFGRQWAYGGRREDGSGDSQEYPSRFMIVEVPDSMTFGAAWISNGEEAPRGTGGSA